MKIIYTKSYDSQLKKLKKHKIEYENLKRIIDAIESTNIFKDLSKTPVAILYKFERLKHQNNGFYSFNLCKNGGKIRLIVKPNENNEVEIYIVFISFEHYEDFDLRKVIYYDEQWKA